MTSPRARRRALLTTLAAAVARPARAWPTASAPLRILVPLAAGGAADAQVRLIGEEVAALLQRPLVVEHRPGGGTVAGTLALANAPPDGNTVGYAVSSLAINQALRRRMPYDALRDLAPVCLGGYSLLALVALPDLPARNALELRRLAAERRPPLQYASLGVGTASHLAGELFAELAGVALEHIPYNGSGAIYQALFGRQPMLAFVTLDSALPHVRNGSLRLLGITQRARTPVFPDIPALAESVPGLEVNGFFGFLAPAGTPAAAVEALHGAFDAALRLPRVTRRLAEVATVATPGSPDAFAAFLRREVARYAELGRRTGLRLD